MLAVHSVTDASGSGDNLPFQGREVARMHNGWLKPPQLTKQSAIQAYIIAIALVECHQFYRLIQALMKFAVSVQAYDNVAIALWGHMVNQIHDAIFHAAHAKVVNNVHNQRWIIMVHVFLALLLH